MHLGDPPVVARLPRRRVPMGTKVDFWLDSVLFVGFVLDEAFGFTGLTVHEWIGLAIAPMLLVHLTLHWDWVVRTTRRLARDRHGRPVLRWVIDVVLLLAMTLCVASGLFISQRALRSLGVSTTADRFWSGLHSTSADVTLVATALHVALSWRWIATTARRLAPRPRAAA